MKNILLAFICTIYCLTTFSQNGNQAFEMNARLGRGINMGNMFDAPSETAWGNPWNPQYFRMISGLGFTHVRVPVRWEPSERSLSGAPYTIYPEFLVRIKTVVDEALKNKLHIIINMHHHEALLQDPAGQKARFLAQWKQIADYFKSYPDSLLFEILNEPNGNLNPSLWNQYASEALHEIRKTNPDRTILIGTAEWGGIGGLKYLQLPEDDHLIATIHYYNPFEFTHQGAEWSDMQNVRDVKWYDSETERAVVHQDFQSVKDFSEKYHIPVHIGEFGSYSKADMESRARWTTYLARWFEEQGFSWAYWEFSAGFGIYDPITEKHAIPLVNALLHNTMPEPAKTEFTSVYIGHFNTDTDGWTLYVQAGAGAALSRSNNKLEVNVSAKGNEGWHIQLVKNNIPLEKGRTYRFTFTSLSSNESSFTNYIGKSADPWNAYSDYKSYTTGNQEKAYTYSFTMKDLDDPSARIVFDLGTVSAPSTLYFSDIRLEKVQIIPTTSIPKIKNIGTISLYPNPVRNELFIDNDGSYHNAAIFSLSGTLQSGYPLVQGLNTIDTSHWIPGIYLIQLKGEKDSRTTKIIKTSR